MTTTPTGMEQGFCRIFLPGGGNRIGGDGDGGRYVRGGYFGVPPSV